MAEQQSLLQETIDQIQNMDDPSVIREEAFRSTRNMVWVPLPGPQTEAYTSEADLLYYGGAGGGGKTDLILGLAMNEHTRSLIFRRKYNDLSAITERAIDINGTRDGYSGSSPPTL